LQARNIFGELLCAKKIPSRIIIEARGDKNQNAVRGRKNKSACATVLIYAR
jgi:hypothetical protein